MKDVMIRDLDDAVYNKIVEKAEKDKRSVNKEIQYLLEKVIEE